MMPKPLPFVLFSYEPHLFLQSPPRVALGFPRPYNPGRRFLNRPATRPPPAAAAASTIAGPVAKQSSEGEAVGNGAINTHLITPKTSTDPDIIAGDHNTDIDITEDTTGKGVAILWDLDNKPPVRESPFVVAQRLRQVIERKYGAIKVMAAYGNKSTLDFVPRWAIDQARDIFKKTLLDEEEDEPAELYRCHVCGQKCKTLVKLQKHVQTLHERERRKKTNHMTSAKRGTKKREKLQTRYMGYLDKYNNAASGLVPRIDYDIVKELTTAMVEVKRVGDRAEAADVALKGHANRLYCPRNQDGEREKTIDCLVLVSDDADFKIMLNRAKRAGVRTVLVGGACDLRRTVDEYISWNSVVEGAE